MNKTLKWHGGRVGGGSGLLHLETELGAEALRVTGDLELVNLAVQVDRRDIDYGYIVHVFSSDGTLRCWRGSVKLPCGKSHGFAEISGVVKQGHLLRVEMKRVRVGELNPTPVSTFTDVLVLVDVHGLGLGSGWNDDPLSLERAMGASL